MSNVRKTQRTWTGKPSDTTDEAPGAAPGTFLSDFALPDLTGRIVRVSDQLGHPYILLFVGTGCKPSQVVLRELARQRRKQHEQSLPVIVCAAGGELNARAVSREYDLGDGVVVQEAQELLRFYRVPATPAAYHVDETRRTVGPLAIGSHDCIGLIRGKATAVQTKKRQQANDSTPVPAKQRTKLVAGSLAPEIVLSAPEGYSISLSAQLGRRMLVIFWSELCPPCDELIERVQDLSNRVPDVLIIGRDGDSRPSIAGNVQYGTQDRRAAAVAFGLPQTPSAVLINETGRLEQPPAEGRAAVLALLNSLI